MKILFYDIETLLMLCYLFGLGKQVVRHNQLHAAYDCNKIICITYCYNDGKPAKALVWDHSKQECTDIIIAFDKLIKEADYVIGKRSDKFDNKHINFQRLLADLPGCADWILATEDLEKQMRKHFNMPSYSLDYISKKLGFGGKDKMEFSDWQDILRGSEAERLGAIVGKEKLKIIYKRLYSESDRAIIKQGRTALKKMVTYGKKDVEDTRDIWNHCEKHFTPKWNMKIKLENRLACSVCGKPTLVKAGTRYGLKTRWQRWYCKSHFGYSIQTKWVE